MKITLISSMYAPYAIGGAEAVTQTQAEALAARGHTVRVLTLGDPGKEISRTILNGVEVVRVGIRNLYFPGTTQPPTWAKVAWHTRDFYNASMGHLARECLLEQRPDIVVCHNLAGWSAAVWPAVKSLGLPLAQVLHDQYFRCIRSNMYKSQRCATQCMSCKLMRLPHPKLSRLPDAVVGVSRYVIDSLVQAGYFRDVPVRTYIHNASHLDTRERSTPALSGPEVVFGFIGSITPAKGLEQLLAAFRRMAQPHWRLRVAGTGVPEYVERLRAEHADSRIEFLGRQDPASFYLGLDATVVPSPCEDALPSVVFESLVHGRPVIGARRGGIPEMVEHGVSGLIFEPDEDGALAAALSDFAVRLGDWRSFQPAIKIRAAPVYCDRENWIGRWQSLFSDVVGGGTGGRARSYDFPGDREHQVDSKFAPDG